MKQMKQFKITFLLAVLMSTVEAKTWAYDVNIDGIFYNLKGTEAEVTYKSGNNYSGTVIIPSSITYKDKEYRVTSIGNYAFAGCSDLTSVTIPSSITNIGFNAFGSGLKEVHITDIAAWCRIRFDYSGNGDEVDYFAVSWSNPLYWNNRLFLNGEEVKDLVIPEGVTAIEPYAFIGCTSITSVTIPNSVTRIGFGAFAYCDNLASAKIPNSVSSIESGLFYDCPKLNSVEIPNSVTSIGYYAFGYCFSLTSVTIPNSVTSIGTYAFRYCNNLTSVTIGNSVTSIGRWAFEGCNGLTSVKVEEGNPVYDSRDNCNAIIETAKNETVLCGSFSSLPISVTSIGENSVVSSPLTIPWSVNHIGNWGNERVEFIMNLNLNEISDWIGKDRIIDSRVSSKVIDENGNDVSDLVIPEGTTTIGSYVFKGVSSLETVTIPNSVTSIGNAAFADCNNIGVVKSYIEDLFGIPSDCFSNSVKQNATLYVPKEMRMFYKLFDGWKEFKNIVAIENSIAPVDINDDIDYGTDSNFDSDTNLNGNVVGNIFYNISDDAGEYSSTEGCIVIKKPTPDDDVENVAGLDINNEQLKDTFTGIIFMVQPGSGTITVNAETTGGMTLKVKVGDNPPTEIELDCKIKEKFPYSVDKASYVYIYAGGGSAGAKAAGTTRASSEDVLKIYGIEWTSGTDGIGVIDNIQLTIDNSPVYNLNGQRVEKPAKGVFIRNGKKVLVK